VRGNATQVVQPQGSNPAWRAMYDDRGHMVVAVNYDTDVGDALGVRRCAVLSRRK